MRSFSLFYLIFRLCTSLWPRKKFHWRQNFGFYECYNCWLVIFIFNVIPFINFIIRWFSIPKSFDWNNFNSMKHCDTPISMEIKRKNRSHIKVLLMKRCGWEIISTTEFSLYIHGNIWHFNTKKTHVQIIRGINRNTFEMNSLAVIVSTILSHFDSNFPL